MEKHYAFNKKIALKAIVIYFILSIVFYYAANERICYTEYLSGVEGHDGYIQELSDGTIVTQSLNFDMDYVNEIRISVATFMRRNTGAIIISLINEEGKILAQKTIMAETIQDNSIEELSVKKAVNDGTHLLKIESVGGEKDASITVYRNSEKNYLGQDYSVNGITYEGSLEISVFGGINSGKANWYWIVVFVTGIVFWSTLHWSIKLAQTDGTNKLLDFFNGVTKYKFLIKQLVERDFKTKYKRSVLGVCWSLLNPILTMAVQYIIFSTIFRQGIENFPLYLLCGSVLFTFFTDSVGNGLMSIVGNASLITKVYVPKYIYPVSKVLSTSINLLLSMIPLLIVVLITKAPITKAYFLIPFVIFCLVLFCIGMSFLLSSAMVFFRDTQFLWGVITILWMYATPLFYPETIIPGHLRFILDFNPMYHYVSFIREIMLYGKSPYLIEYVYCIGFSILVMLCGIFVYKKTENKFILYI